MIVKAAEKCDREERPMGIRSDLLAATRRALCETAMRLFVERGVAATKVEDILKASGISVGSFYYLFKNKLDLAATLYLEIQSQFYQYLLQELFQQKGAQAGIEATVRAYLHWATDHPVEMYYLLYRRDVEILEIADEKEKASETDFRQHLEEWLQPSLAAKVLRPLSLDHCLALWFGPTFYLVHTVLSPFGTCGSSRGQEWRGQLLASEEVMVRSAWQALRSE
jgi:AcrR family transcriptional regulator